jgi:hypothetical protein
MVPFACLPGARSGRERFDAGWLTADPGHLEVLLLACAGHPAYGPGPLAADLTRFAFLPGGAAASICPDPIPAPPVRAAHPELRGDDADRLRAPARGHGDDVRRDRDSDLPRFPRPRPRHRAEAAERFEGGPKDRFGIADPPLPSEPLPVAQPELAPARTADVNPACEVVPLR